MELIEPIEGIELLDSEVTERGLDEEYGMGLWFCGEVAVVLSMGKSSTSIESM